MDVNKFENSKKPEFDYITRIKETLLLLPTLCLGLIICYRCLDACMYFV